MTTVCHLLDRQGGWEQRLAAGQLVEHAGQRTWAARLASLGSAGARSPGLLPRLPVAIVSPSGLGLAAAPAVGRWLRDAACEVVHTWGVQAALAARCASAAPVVLELFDPAISRRHATLIRVLSAQGPMAVCCSSQTVRRRLIEASVPPSSCVVIRPGVDFGLLNRCRSGPNRASLGLSQDDLVVLCPPAGTVGLDVVEAAWSVTLASHSRPRAKLVLAGEGPELHRVQRLLRATPRPNVLVRPPNNVPFENLIAAADVLVVPARKDVSTTAVAWAMGAGALVIGSATHSIAELIASRLNGLLFKPQFDESLAVPLARLLLEHHQHDKLREVARGHAYEVFGVRRFVEQHRQLYSNLLGGAAAGEGIQDSAVVA